MSRIISLAVGEYYHIYTRGVDKRIVFETDFDRERFISLLYLCNGNISVDLRYFSKQDKGSTFSVFDIDVGKPLVSIGAYCLMLNHFHILLRENTEGGVSKFMQKLSTAYTMYFNSSRNRTGALFQGRFKASHVDSDVYLKYLFSYIHLNPLKIFNPQWKNTYINTNDAKKFLTTYIFSSYLDYKSEKRIIGKVIDPTCFPKYFPKRVDFDKSISDWINLKIDLEI